LREKLTQKLSALSFTHKKEFIVWYSEAKKDDTRARRLQKMKQMLSAGKVISRRPLALNFAQPQRWGPGSATDATTAEIVGYSLAYRRAFGWQSRGCLGFGGLGCGAAKICSSQSISAIV
jgi:hypothetical protein